MIRHNLIISNITKYWNIKNNEQNISPKALETAEWINKTHAMQI